MELSKRLQAAADLVTLGCITADIGCDHGYVSIYLVERKICSKVIAMDINSGPLERAEQHIRKYGFCAYIETRLSNGAEKLGAGEVDCILCAGMGGRLIVRILAEGGNKVKGVRELILQPQSEIQMVRAYLRCAGFVIEKENIIYEDGKYYPLMKAVSVNGIHEVKAGASAENQELFDRWGEQLLLSRNPVLKDFILAKKAEWSAILQSITNSQLHTHRQALREEEILSKLRLAEQALDFYRT